jgi:hypothetical protein
MPTSELWDHLSVSWPYLALVGAAWGGLVWWLSRRVHRDDGREPMNPWQHRRVREWEEQERWTQSARR